MSRHSSVFKSHVCIQKLTRIKPEIAAVSLLVHLRVELLSLPLELALAGNWKRMLESQKLLVGTSVYFTISAEDDNKQGEAEQRPPLNDDFLVPNRPHSLATEEGLG